MRKEHSQSGQIVVIFLLIIVVALSIALSLVGRTITEVSTSADSESSSRAFSAAEAGIEKAIKDYGIVGLETVDKNLTIAGEVLTNRSSAEVNLNQGLPRVGVALEYPPFGKDSFAQFWLANPGDLSAHYTEDSFDIYFGTAMDYTTTLQEQPAITVHSIYKTGTTYKSKLLSYDSFTVGDATTASTRNDSFKACQERNPQGIYIVTNQSTGADRAFYCKVRVNNYKEAGSTPIMLRIKFQYTSSAHPLAVAPISSVVSLPSQVNIYDSTGLSGNVQRNIKVFRQENVMPFFFDYVLFSAGDLSK